MQVKASSESFWRRLARGGVMAVAAVSAVAAGMVAVHAQNAPAPSGGAAPATVIELTASELTAPQLREMVRSTPLTGALRPRDWTTVKMRVAGEIQQFLVREGEQVNKGQVIARLDPLDFQARLDEKLADLEGGAAGVLQGSAATLFNACQVISLVALLLAWFFVFDVAQATRRELEPQAEGIVGTAAGASVSSRSDGPSGMGHSIDLPAEVVLAAAERGDHALQETYAEVSRDAGGDEPKSAADAVATRAKLTLLRRFLMGATLYVAARAAAIVVPLAVLPAPSQADAATTAASVCEDAVRLLFLAALALIFRAREDSPYLMVGEGGGIGGDGTGVGAAGLTTELGVLRGRDEIGGSEGDFDEERPASASSRLPPPRAPLFPASELRSDASPPPQQQQKKKKAPAVALAPPPRSPALASSSSSPYRPAGAAAAPAVGAAAAGAGAARVDARFALDDDSDSDYGGGASSGGAAAPAPAAAAAPGVAAPPPARRDSTEEIPL